MSRLDDIKPSRPNGEYSCELLVEGTWVTLAVADRQTIERAADILAGLEEEEII